MHNAYRTWPLLASLWIGCCYAQTEARDPYRLPPSKRFLAACQAAAGEAKPGTIIQMQEHWEHGVYRFRFRIQSADGAEWSLDCNGADGKIVRMELIQPAAAP